MQLCKSNNPEQLKVYKPLLQTIQKWINLYNISFVSPLPEEI